jgi:hypothetical protein
LVLVAGEACSERQALRSCGVSLADFDAAPFIETVADRAAERPDLYAFLSDASAAASTVASTDAPSGDSNAPAARLRGLRSLDDLPPALHAAVLLNEALWDHGDDGCDDGFG